MSEQPIVKRPLVARTASRLPALLGGAAALAMGVAVFVGLDSRREAQAATYVPATQPLNLPTPQPLPAVPPPVPAPQFTVNNSVPSPAPTPVVTAAPAPTMAPAAEDMALKQRLSAPSLIVDFTQSPETQASPLRLAALQTNPAMSGVAGGVAGVTAAQAAGAARADGALETEAFGRRAPADGPERVRAERMGSLDMTVPQGAIVEAVLETALDSDLPGYARAQVSRDVLSFDGVNVLIPRGSRVIGQYKAATALGASRIFVIWSRVIRPDGVSIQLASPATDELGRAGLGGKVDRHFLQRFGGAILLSVLNGGIAAGTAAATSGSGVYISSVSDATSAATSALRGTDIPPTIRTPQGASVRIFVARDLDFAQVGAMR